MADKDKGNKKPEWVDKNRPDIFATQIMNGVAETRSVSPRTDRKRPKKPELSVEDLCNGILENDKMVLGRAITLIESNHPDHQAKGKAVLKQIAPHTGKAIRIGISGVPGAGKSTLIETFGLYLIRQGFKVAVLAVDPSSARFGGSILGDKTRMEQLAKETDSFIRPSPSGGSLGGVTRKSRESILICEAAGFDVILVETVGVGQNEISVRSMVDFFLLVMISGAGDELQGIKKGVVEIADALIINKADGDNIDRAEMAAAEYRQAFKYLENATAGWKTEVRTCSALKQTGIPEIWEMIRRFESLTRKTGIFERRRKEQKFSWVKSMAEGEILNSFYRDPEIVALMEQIETQVKSGQMLPTEASDLIIAAYLKRIQ